MLAGTNSGKLIVDSMIFVWEWSKKGSGLLINDTQNLLYPKNEFMNRVIFLNADSDALSFG